MLWVRAKHSGKLVDVALEGDRATIRDLKEQLAALLHIPAGKQRLLVASHPGKLPPDDAVMAVALPRVCSSTPPAAAAPATVMVVGVPEVHIRDDVAASATASSIATASADAAGTTGNAERNKHLVSVTVDAPEGMYNCSYVVGNTAQDAFYCRTCVDAGFAQEAHFMCYACAEVCHKGHDVENWGLHHFLRCDCCTTRCCTPSGLSQLEMTRACEAVERSAAASGSNGDSVGGAPSPSEESAGDAVTPRRCRFVVDERTALPPRTPLAPNVQNAYPDDLKTWCYCRGTDALPEEVEEGLNCMMCHSCFYAPHIGRLNTDPFLLVSCYAETSGCDTLGYKCETCDDGKVYCPPCAVHCHEGHVLALEDPVRFDWRQGATEAERSMVCGCRAACKIAHVVPETHLIELSKRLAPLASAPPIVTQTMATQLIEDDELSAFVCARCMQRYPWLWDPAAAEAAAVEMASSGGGPPCPMDLCALRHCWRGRLPAAVAEAEIRPPLGCRAAIPPAATRRDVFPYHGMLVPEDIQKFVCQCNLCQDAYAAMFPRNTSATETALQLFSSYGNQCQHCGTDVERACGYFCVTCELQTTAGDNAGGASNSFFVCEACARDPAVRLAHQQACSPGGGAAHEFQQDSVENLWRVLGASLVHTVDDDTRVWMLEHWNDGPSREAVLEFMRESFGARRLQDARLSYGRPATAAPGPAGGAGGGECDGDDASASRKRGRSGEDGDGGSS